jgi:hypothetical protein
MSNRTIALPITVADIVEEYAAKVANVDNAIADFKTALDTIKGASVVSGYYVENVVGDLYLRPDAIRLNLRKSGWKAVWSRLQIDRVASARDKRLFEQTLADPPELTLDNAKATFGDYLLRPRFHALRGLAECFIQLDPAYKSHSKVKIGVAGLPKRVILSNVGRYGSWGRDLLINILNALAAVQGKPLVDHEELRGVDAFGCSISGHKAGEFAFDGAPLKRYDGTEWTPPARGVTLRKFQNGNGHVIFDPPTLLDINRALAEFYGEVLPDVEDDGEDGELFMRRASPEVAKDLQFYPTPRAVIETVLYEIGITNPETRWAEKFEPKSGLEPSCGDGRIMDVVRERRHRIMGVEVHQGRAEAAKRKGHAVVVGNFLERPAAPHFDFVVMNPPFYGVHWKKHLAHAQRFVKPDGVLACILPASAEYDHGVAKQTGGRWHDLPVASFAESGTNIPTGYLVWRA